RQALDAMVMAKERALQMRMSKKRDAAIEIGRNLSHVLLGSDVFVLIQRRTVKDLKAVDAFWSLSESAQIFGMLRLDHGLRPQSGEARQGIEPFQILQARAGFIVIAAHDSLDIFANP